MMDPKSLMILDIVKLLNQLDLLLGLLPVGFIKVDFQRIHVKIFVLLKLHHRVRIVLSLVNDLDFLLISHPLHSEIVVRYVLALYN